MSQVAKSFIRWQVRMVLVIGSALARRPVLGRLTPMCMRILARMRTKRPHGPHPAPDPRLLGETWQNAFPGKRHVPIISVDAETAYARITTRCPLRGSGDLRACWRMMAFDREVAKRAGGHFYVLRSQAEPGVVQCEVAISRRHGIHQDKGAEAAGLEALHEPTVATAAAPGQSR